MGSKAKGKPEGKNMKKDIKSQGEKPKTKSPGCYFG